MMDNISEKLVEILVEPCCGLYPASELADYLIEQGVTVQEWIPVTERLPEDEAWMLVCRKDLGTGLSIMRIEYCTFTVGGYRMWIGDFGTWKSVVTHWMPLPTPPKGE